MGTVAAVLSFLEEFLPRVVSVGVQIAPFVASLRDAWDSFAAANGATQADFDRFHALIKPYEDDLQAQADKAQQEIDGGA